MFVLWICCCEKVTGAKGMYSSFLVLFSIVFLIHSFFFSHPKNAQIVGEFVGGNEGRD